MSFMSSYDDIREILAKSRGRHIVSLEYSFLKTGRYLLNYQYKMTTEKDTKFQETGVESSESEEDVRELHNLLKGFFKNPEDPCPIYVHKDGKFISRSK